MGRLVAILRRLLCRHAYQFAGFLPGPRGTTIRVERCLRCPASKTVAEDSI